MTAPRRSRSTVLASFVLAASLALALLPASPASAAVIVRGSGRTWTPSIVRISRGGSVRWRGVSGTHFVRSYGGGWTYSHALSAGTTTPARTFNRAGTFRFYCTIHGSVVGGVCSGMCGKIVVH
jgi:plastocyanin